MNDKLPTFNLEEYNHLTGQAAETGFEAFSNYKENLSSIIFQHIKTEEFIFVNKWVCAHPKYNIDIFKDKLSDILFTMQFVEKKSLFL